MNIVALSPNDWDGQWVNRQQLLSRLACKRPILYSTGGWSIWDRHSPAYRASSRLGRVEPKDNVLLDHPGRWLPRWPGLRMWDKAAIARQARRWRAAFATGGNAPVVAYVCHPMFMPYVEALRPDYLVYHCYDLFAHQPGWTDELAVAERQLLARADLIFSPTQMLSDYLMQQAPCQALVLQNAADVQVIFEAAHRKVAPPPDLAVISSPRIGYVGSIHPQLDLALVAELSLRQPLWQFVLIGPEQGGALLQADAGYQACRARPNVHLLGERHRHVVPDYLLHMDANIMFYRLTPDSWTHVAYPLKLHEYLACGRPVVSVNLRMIQQFAGLIDFADGVDAWEKALTKALSEQDASLRAQRRGVAAKNSWETRTAVLDAWLTDLPLMRAQRLATASART